MQVAGEPWCAEAARVAAVCTRLLPGLAGVYVHGSAALGGFTAASDLDVLVIADGPVDAESAGRDLLAATTGFPLELSIVTSGAATDPSPPFPFILHVASPDRAVIDHGDGDPDLIAHFAVTRTAGRTVMGPAPREVIGAVDRSALLAYLTGELAWGRDHADQRYAVLNACRAEAYAVDGCLLSKTDGARWWTRRHGSHTTVVTALAAQKDGRDLGSCNSVARTLVDRVIDLLTTRPS